MNGNENDALEQSENESIPEGVQEELDSQAENPQTPAQNPVSMVLDTAGKEAVVSGSKKAIAMLLKKKFLFVALIAGGALILIIILFAVMDSSGVDDYIFQEPLCETVTVHYDPYGPGEEETFTMDLEDYVKSAVYAYTRDLTTSTASTYHLYFSLSVALRNEAMTHDCEVTYRNMEIPRTVGEVDYYFDTAIENSYGIAMVDENEEFIETTVSSFCWSSQGTVTDIFEEEMPGYTLYQPGGMGVPNDFVAPYFDNPVYQNCECNLDTGVETITEREYNNQDQCYMYWYTEEELEDGTIQYHYYREYQHQDHADPVGYSLYAANYLLRTGSNYTQILKYFYGEDILLRTTQEENSEIDENEPSANCSTFSLTTTTLSRDEFIEKMQSYSNSHSDWATFQQNAGTIYDIATSNGVNPEIIVVRAILEGFSPGGSSHNYWGINCTNTGGGVDCRDYGSFDDGVLAMAELVKSYDSFDDMMSRYAYIGAYWYDDDIPNASGVGGCYYFESIRDYMSSERASEVANICATTTCTRSNTGNCTPTTDEDQQAYAEFQKANMTNQRFAVFGIDEDACTNDVLTVDNCVVYAQGDDRWGSHYLGNSTSTTMHESGCAVTSVAIALTCTGQVQDVGNFSPLVLNDTLVRTGGFDGSLIVWNNAGIREFVPTFRVAADYGLEGVSNDIKLDRLAAANEHENWIGIAHISNAEHSSHFVVVSSYNEVDNTFIALDPAGGVINTYSINDLDRIIYYSY